MKKLFYILIMVLVLSCGSEPTNSLSVGYKGVQLQENYESINGRIPGLKSAPDHVSKKRGEGFKEYFTLEEPSFIVEGVRFNPSSFYVFNANDELVSFSVFYVVEVEKESFDVEDIISKLNNNQVQGLLELSKAKEMKMDVTPEIGKSITLDMEGSRYPVLIYKYKYLP